VSDDKRDHGKITFGSNDRHYGFIRPDHGERDVFVHGSALEGAGEARIGDRVSYMVAADRRPGRDAKLCARAVRFVNGDKANEKPGPDALADGKWSIGNVP
jgi:CspA family cold shock protein